MKKIDRNAPCHCGSGKKYKQCCLSHDEALAATRHAASTSVAISLQEAFAHLSAGRLTEATTIYQQILQHNSDHPDALLYLGVAEMQKGKTENAITLISKSLSIQPDSAQAHNNLGLALREQGTLSEAIVHFHKAISIESEYAAAHNNLGVAHSEQGALSKAIAHFQTAVAINPEYVAAHNNRLFHLAQTEDMTAQALFTEHLRFGTQFGTPLRSQWVAHTQSRDPERCLKIGFVSGDFFNHAVVSFIEPVLAQLSNNANLSLYAYANSSIDDVTIRLRDYFAHWQKVVSLTDDALAQQIRDDGIDILIDLSGHTAKNRLLTFARKPAPIQVSWLGYLGTTGLEAMDYYLADRYLVPPGEIEQQFIEKIVHLPVLAPFMPSAYAPPVNPLPALTNGYVTFGSFNRLNKLNPMIVGLWSQLLRARPNSRMVLGAMPEPGEYENLIAWFAQEGISRERLSFHKRCDMVDYLALHQLVDICLDTFPYAGGTTNCHALWMGVPTLCLRSGATIGRFGADILAQVGLDEFIADDAADFVLKGLFWSEHFTELSGIRTGLRERFKQSALGQPAVVATGLAQALRMMWQRWCEGLPTEAFEINPEDINKVLQEAKQSCANSLQTAIADHLAGRLHEAVAIYQQILRHDPEHSDALHYMGLAASQLGMHENAMTLIRKSLFINPDNTEAHNNLANLLRDHGRLDESIAHCHTALSLNPNYAEAHNNLGNALMDQGALSEAIAHLHTSLSIKPEYVNAHNNLGNVLQLQANLTGAVQSYRRALAIKPDYAEAYSNLLFCLAHMEGMTAQALFTEHLRFDAQFGVPLRSQWVAHTQSRDPERCLKIGFVSGDFFNHAVVSFIEPVLAQLSNNANLSLYAYANSSIDDVTIRLRDYFAHWQKVVSLTDDALAQQIRDDGIDILIDLSGHTAKNRLLTFARKPAPIQVSWLGYLGTTGLEAMDYYLADRYLVPPGEIEQQFIEKIVHLPVLAPFMPSAYAPPVNPLPALTNGYVTFGSFNRLNKLNPMIVGLWSQLLRARPNSRMVLGAMPEPGEYENLIAWFAQEGISRERLSFHKRCDMVDYLALHQLVDICLDTFPYAGGTTNCHALWMGVPTLCLRSGATIGRFGADILAQVGLDEFIADDAADFVLKGLFWSEHFTELSGIRTGLRERFKQSALGQPAVVATGLAQALRMMWQRWCEGLPTEAFEINPEDINKVLQEAKQSCANSLQTAIADHLAGRLHEAVAIYQQILRHDPEHSDALHYMGLAASQLGMHENAMTLIRKSLFINPDNTEAHNNLANLQRGRGRFGMAIADYHNEDLLTNMSMVFPEKKHPYYIVAPHYTRMSAGIKVLHLLCHALNRLGERAYMITLPTGVSQVSSTSPELNTPLLTKHILDYDFKIGLSPIIVYPEIIKGNPFQAPFVVRYVLNFPGLLGGDKIYDADEFCIAYSKSLRDAISHCRMTLFFPISDPRIFQPYPRVQRQGSCFYASKYKALGGKLHETTANSVEITRNQPDSQTQEEIAELFRRSEIFYAYENTSLTIEAILCECPVVLIPNPHLNLNGLIGIHEVGTDGVCFGLDPVEMERAKSTVKQGRERYLKIVESTKPQIQDFIAQTQLAADQHCYHNPIVL